METRNIVSVSVPAGQAIGILMNAIRTWLDHHKIQPIQFKPAVSRGGWDFEVIFHSEDDACLFQREFGGALVPA